MSKMSFEDFNAKVQGGASVDDNNHVAVDYIIIKNSETKAEFYAEINDWEDYDEKNADKYVQTYVADEINEDTSKFDKFGLRGDLCEDFFKQAYKAYTEWDEESDYQYRG